jgi:hypothetical protein
VKPIQQTDTLASAIGKSIVKAMADAKSASKKKGENFYTPAEKEELAKMFSSGKFDRSGPLQAKFKKYSDQLAAACGGSYLIDELHVACGICHAKLDLQPGRYSKWGYFKRRHWKTQHPSGAPTATAAASGFGQLFFRAPGTSASRPAAAIVKPHLGPSGLDGAAPLASSSSAFVAPVLSMPASALPRAAPLASSAAVSMAPSLSKLATVFLRSDSKAASWVPGKRGNLEWSQNVLTSTDTAHSGDVACVGIAVSTAVALLSNQGLCARWLRPAAVNGIDLSVAASQGKDVTVIPSILLESAVMPFDEKDCISGTFFGGSAQSLLDCLSAAITKERRCFVLTDSYQRSLLVIGWRGDRGVLQLFWFDSHRCTKEGLVTDDGFAWWGFFRKPDELKAWLPHRYETNKEFCLTPVILPEDQHPSAFTPHADPCRVCSFCFILPCAKVQSRVFCFSLSVRVSTTCVFYECVQPFAASASKKASAVPMVRLTSCASCF